MAEEIQRTHRIFIRKKWLKIRVYNDRKVGKKIWRHFYMFEMNARHQKKRLRFFCHEVKRTPEGIDGYLHKVKVIKYIGRYIFVKEEDYEMTDLEKWIFPEIIAWVEYCRKTNASTIKLQKPKKVRKPCRARNGIKGD